MDKDVGWLCMSDYPQQWSFHPFCHTCNIDSRTTWLLLDILKTISISDKFDDYYDSKAGIDDLIKRITDQMCADDDCKKNRIAKITPLVVNLVDQEAMMRDVCQYTYNCFAEKYEYK